MHIHIYIYDIMIYIKPCFLISVFAYHIPGMTSSQRGRSTPVPDSYPADYHTDPFITTGRAVYVSRKFGGTSAF